MFTPNDIAKELNVSLATVYGLIRSGLLVCHRIGAAGKRGCIRIAAADFAAFLESRKTKKGEQAVKPTPPRRKIKLQHLQMPV
jgi:excisionase family DNA binding protein